MSLYRISSSDIKQVSVYDINGKYLYTKKSQVELARNLCTYKETIRRSCILGTLFKEMYHLSYIKADSYSEANRI